MSLTAGIVGLPNVGKSTLFNAITKQNILAANYPFATIDPNVGIVTVPDERLDFLNKLYEPKSLVPTSFEFTDIAGLVKGASSGEGLGNKFLSHIREVDAIVEVVRCFEDSNITHVDGKIDPVRDIETINAELAIADLEVIENRINRIGKKASMSKDKETLLEVELLNKLKENLEKSVAVRQIELTKEEQKYIISSALKRVDNSLALTMDSFLNDSLEFNSHSVLGIKEDAIGLAENDIYTSIVKEEIRNKVAETAKQLKDDKVTVNSALGMEEAKLKEIINSAK